MHTLKETWVRMGRERQYLHMSLEFLLGTYPDENVPVSRAFGFLFRDRHSKPVKQSALGRDTSV